MLPVRLNSGGSRASSGNHSAPQDNAPIDAITYRRFGIPAARTPLVTCYLEPEFATQLAMDGRMAYRDIPNEPSPISGHSEIAVANLSIMDRHH